MSDAGDGAATTEPQPEPVDQPPPARSESKRDGVTGQRLALLSVLVTLVVAVLGIVATVYVSHESNDAFDRRTERDFLHNQRVGAFATFIGEDTDLEALELDAWTRLTNLEQGPVPASQADLAKVDAQFPRLTAAAAGLRRDLGPIVLVGGAATINAASDMVEQHGRVQDAVSRFESCFEPQPSSCSGSYVKIYYKSARDALEQAVTRFEAAAKAELRSS